MNTTAIATTPQLRRPYYKFYKVYKNDTVVTEVSVCPAKAACSLSLSFGVFLLPPDEYMYYGFLSRTRAMKHAKAQALKYINKLIDEGEKSQALLLKYREDHYEDLNFNLVESNIKQVEKNEQFNPCYFVASTKDMEFL